MSGVIEESSIRAKVRRASPPLGMRDFAENRSWRQTGVRSPTSREGYSRTVPSLTVGLLTLLTEFLIGQKNLCIFVSKENQPHFFQLPVGRQKVFDRARRNFSGFSLRIGVDTGRDRREGD